MLVVMILATLAVMILGPLILVMLEVDEVDEQNAKGERKTGRKKFLKTLPRAWV